jgi:hypothetical protein
MKHRCFSEKNENYHHYGGRGITVCQEWTANFKSFFDWAMANGWESGLEIDRRNNDGNYTPENCRIVTRKVNSGNRRSCVYITYNGKTQSLMGWCEELNLPYKRTSERYHLGYELEKVFSNETFRGSKKYNTLVKTPKQ